MESPASTPVVRLPSDVTRFVGRRRELAEAKRLFTLTRLVTLTGVGGVGKTRLAIRLARDLARDLRHGVCFVPLAELRDPELLGHAVADALGLRDSSREWTTDILAAHLADKQMLLLLDNCEHQLDACAALVGELLARCPALRVLATSREPLLVSSESTFPVPQMTMPDTDCLELSALTQYDAVNLFLDRAASAVPSFALTAENHLDVARLCHALDGLPLALELAAVRLRALSLTQILTRLTERYSLLTIGSRDAPARQQTLRSLIAWSYDLCTPDEQLLWARLSVFSGGIELDAAEGVCSDELLPRDDIFELLASLVSKSILIREEHGPVVRYRLLETIRQYGVEQLRQIAEWRAWRLRHRRFYSDLIARTSANWVAAGRVEVINRLRRDHANIRAALDFCGGDQAEATSGLQMASDLYFYWITRGHLSEGRHWLDVLLKLDSLPDESTVRGLHVAASLAVLQGDTAAAARLIDEGQASAERIDDRAGSAHIVQARALVALFEGDHGRAITLFRDAVEVFEDVGDRNAEYFTLILLGLAHVFRGDGDAAAECHRRCRAMTRPGDESWGWSYALWVAGLDALRCGAHERAKEHITESLRIKRAFDDRLGIAECVEALACVGALAGQGERAATLLGAADSIWKALGIAVTALPGLLEYHQRCTEAARGIGARPFTSAFDRGRSMPLDRAMAFALDERDDESPASPPQAPSTAALTRRETEVAALVSRGSTNRDIASGLGISRRTAEAHVENILVKLGFTSRTQIAAWVAGQGAHPTPG